jgi:hypothetical protein
MNNTKQIIFYIKTIYLLFAYEIVIYESIIYSKNVPWKDDYSLIFSLGYFNNS